MLRELLSLVVEGLVSPRTSARRVIERGDGLEAGILFMLLGYAVQAIFEVVLIGSPENSGPAFARHGLGMVIALGYFFILSSLAFGLGRMSGGTGSRTQAQAIVGWHTLVTSFLSPLSIGMVGAVREMQTAEAVEGAAPMAIDGGALMFGVLGLGLWLWLMANYVAELHKFSNTWGVLGVLVGLPVAIAVFLITVFGASPPVS